jgi:GntP family gluconate:H+ symporter
MHPLVVLAVATSFVFLLIIRFKVNAFIALVTAAMTVGVLSPRIKFSEAMPQVARIFGDVAANIAIVIGLAAVIAQCLMESGAADKISRRLVGLLGERHASVALLVSGFVLAIPVFFDTVFYLLVPLARAMAVRTEKNYLAYVMSICAGGAIAHTLVPPTPGPIAMATTLEVDLGVVILVGIFIGGTAAVAGWLFGRMMDRRLNISLREAPGLSMEELRDLAHKREDELPGLFVSSLPIVLPVVLITMHTVTNAAAPGSPLLEYTAFFGNPNFALLISTAIALGVLAKQKGYSLAQLARPVEIGLFSAGLIVLITCAGGAFGGMLAKAGVGEALSNLADRFGVSKLVLAFLLGALFKIAQGSSTAAMITSATILAPLVVGQELPFHPVYVVMAIGAGSKIGSWMNDSGFWVVKQMSGLTEAETLKTWTPLLALMGVTAFVFVLLGSWLLPMR